MFENKRFLVFGAGISGMGSIKLLSTITDKIVLYDGNAELDIQAVKEKYGVEADFDICLGVRCYSRTQHILNEQKYGYAGRPSIRGRRKISRLCGSKAASQ